MRLLNEKEAAERIGMSVHYMRRLRVVGGGIPYIKLGGLKSAVRYEEGAIEAFIGARIKTSTSQG
jgi:predicted DNA-binding transcriptional regulator AlpA